jgi:cell pole-organizing protein PopZ
MSASLSASAGTPPAGLASAETMTAAASSVTNLVRALTSDRSTQVHSGGPTIADLVREELRPMLKSWLDSNLPPLVERLVRSEIERVISRAAL